jgi:hypothetical protein
MRRIPGITVETSAFARMKRIANVRANVAVSDGAPLDPTLRHALKAHRWDRAPASWSG